MTSRERLIAAGSGGLVDHKPVIAWPCQASADSDAVVVFDPARLQTTVASAGDQIVLAEVPNPFGLALERDIHLNRDLRSNPVYGDEVLDLLACETRTRIDHALSQGADGILYRLHGATPTHSTPMEYGGHHLERDRELLAGAAKATLNIIFIVGDHEPYFDFVADLPAHVFAWDSQATGVTIAQMKKMRVGTLCSADPDSDILLASPEGGITEIFERKGEHAGHL